MTTRAFARFARTYTDGPVAPDCTCADCGGAVESLDSRGTCDDCAVARAARDEADELAACESGLAGDEGFVAWCEARRAESIEHECAAERPLSHRAAA
jgi:hypothetical protein